jgi:hypothetical protein
MRGTIIHGTRDIRLEQRPDPTIVNATDAIVSTVAACVCGSDLWRYRGIQPVTSPTPMGHEYVGIVEAVGADVTSVKPGQFVVGGFLTSDNTCPLCRVGAHANCLNVTGYDGCQAELIRVQNADGALLATPDRPDQAMMPSLLALSDVMCTGWHAAGTSARSPSSTCSGRTSACVAARLQCARTSPTSSSASWTGASSPARSSTSPCPGPGGRGVRRHGRAPIHQDTAHPLTWPGAAVRTPLTRRGMRHGFARWRAGGRCWSGTPW